MKLTPNFVVAGINEDCPRLTASVWMEPPASCVAAGVCDAAGTTVVIDDLVNGPWSQDFTMATHQGEWYAHVTVSPYGFECAMALTDACTAVDVVTDCQAVISNFSGFANKDPSKDDYFFGDNGMIHTMNWAITDLWNCNKCATLSVIDEAGKVTETAVMDFAALLAFSENPAASEAISSWTSYFDFSYTLEVCDCGSTDKSTC
jgi:hypothetical protein